MLFRYIPQYRLPFLQLLHETCARQGIDFTVIYGEPVEEDAARADQVDFSPGIFIRNRSVKLGASPIIWQPALAQTRSADLVIVEQQIKLLVNYFLLFRQGRRVQKVAFFGHGRNLQARGKTSLAERLKRQMVCLPHWWFVYTQGVARYVADLGYPTERITVFDNAIDTRQLLQWQSEIGATELNEARQRLNLQSNNVCVFVGSMYPDKKIRFLLEAAQRIRARIPDFSLLFIGSGPDAPIVQRFCDENSWAVYLGPQFGRDKVKYCLLARLLLLPGAVGLTILDAFAMGTPLVTTDMPFHGPEIEYLTDGATGVIVRPSSDVDGYASRVAALLSDRSQLSTMTENCHQAAARLTVENMAERFFQGIDRALAMKLPS